jgi:hypothetical protein
LIPFVNIRALLIRLARLSILKTTAFFSSVFCACSLGCPALLLFLNRFLLLLLAIDLLPDDPLLVDFFNLNLLILLVFLLVVVLVLPDDSFLRGIPVPDDLFLAVVLLYCEVVDLLFLFLKFNANDAILNFNFFSLSFFYPKSL